MRRRQRGSFTIEASVIVPMILMMFVLIMYVIFYYHDKNILAGAAYETAAVGGGRGAYEEEELAEYFRRRVRGKLILFSNIREEVRAEKETITVRCTAQKKAMKVTVQASAARTAPETFIRNIRKAEKLGGKLGEEK